MYGGIFFPGKNSFPTRVSVRSGFRALATHVGVSKCPSTGPWWERSTRGTFRMALSNFLKISLLFHATIKSDEGFIIIFIKGRKQETVIHNYNYNCIKTYTQRLERNMQIENNFQIGRMMGNSHFLSHFPKVLNAVRVERLDDDLVSISHINVHFQYVDLSWSPPPHQNPTKPTLTIGSRTQSPLAQEITWQSLRKNGLLRVHPMDSRKWGFLESQPNAVSC